MQDTTVVDVGSLSGGRRLVGRDRELASLEGFLQEAEVCSRALVVDGEAGIGKSTLWETGLSMAEASGYRVMRCRPAEAEQGSAFTALTDLLSPLGDDDLRDLPDVQRRALEVALLIEEPDPSGISARAVAAGTLGVLRARGRAGLVLVGIDDAQWVDRSSAAVLSSALRRLEGEPVSVLSTSRLGVEPPDPIGLSRAFGPTRLDTLTIHGLDVDAISYLVRTRLGWEPPRPVLVTIHQRSGGNPFFALELARAAKMSEGGLDHAVGIPAPEDLAATLRARIARLSPAGRDTLLTAAAAGVVSIQLLECAVNDPAAVAASLGELREVGLVEVHGDAVKFTHPLFASAAYAEATTRERRAVHGRLAAAATDVEERARHLAFASSAPDVAASAKLADAARHAHSRGAEWAAAELSELAADLVPDTPQALDLRAAAADHLFRAGDRAAATRLLRSVVDRMPAGGPRAERLLRLAEQTLVDDLPASITICREALATGDASELVQAELHRVSARGFEELGSHREALGELDEAIRLARSVGDPSQIANILALRAAMEVSLDREVYQRAEALNARWFTISDRPTANLAFLLVAVDALDEARAILEPLLREAVEEGDESSEGWAHMVLGCLEERAGNLRLSLQHYDRMRWLGTWPFEHPAHAYTEALLGRFDEARARLSIPTAEGSDAVSWHWPAFVASVRGFIELSAGDHAAAAAAYGPAWEETERLLAQAEQPYLAYNYPADAVEALLHVGSRDQAERIVRWLEWWTTLVTWPRVHVLAARTRGLLLSSDGDLSGAIAALERARDEHERCPVPFERARTLLALGSVRRRAKQKRPARDDLQEALAIFERIETPLWAQRARAELASIGGRATATGALTPTEERVARLAAGGWTNREIADELFLSVRTVESHLSRSYAKLGVRSRTELAFTLEPPVSVG